MRTTLTPKLATVAAFTVALSLFTLAPLAVTAQEQGSAKGGATLLMKPAIPFSTTDYKPMACANCKDTVVAIPDTDFKGAGARAQLSGGTPTINVVKHLCTACSNDWVVKGHGKAKAEVPVHKCATCG
jgi:hypothetical protein